MRFVEDEHPLCEIDPAGEQPDDRHDDVAHQRVDDLPKRHADDEADGQVDRVALIDECLEFFEHAELLRWSFRPRYL